MTIPCFKDRNYNCTNILPKCLYCKLNNKLTNFKFISMPLIKHVNLKIKQTKRIKLLLSAQFFNNKLVKNWLNLKLILMNLNKSSQNVRLIIARNQKHSLLISLERRCTNAYYLCLTHRKSTKSSVNKISNHQSIKLPKTMFLTVNLLVYKKEEKV